VSETWIQEYGTAFGPGPDGEPLSMDMETRQVRSLIVQWPDSFDDRAGVIQRMTERHNGRIRQSWRRIG